MLVRCPVSPHNPRVSNTASSPPSPRAPGLFRRLGAAGPVAIAASTWPPIGAFLLLASITSLGPWLREHGALGMALYFLGVGLLMGVAAVPTLSCAALAGWAFGFAAGWPLAVAAATTASLLAYAIGRWAARDRVLEIVRERPKWDAVYRALFAPRRGRALLVVTLVRLPPASPFALASLVLAAGRAPLGAYAAGTMLGLAPRLAIAAYAAAGLQQLELRPEPQTWVFVAGVALTLGALAIIGHLANRALARLAAAG